MYVSLRTAVYLYEQTEDESIGRERHVALEEGEGRDEVERVKTRRKGT